MIKRFYEDLSMDCPFDVEGGRNELYIALIEGEFEVARKLYDDGQRVDIPLQNCSDENAGNKSIGANYILQFLSHEATEGRNYFYNENRTLEHCCRYAQWHQAEQLFETASEVELKTAMLALPQSISKSTSSEKFYKILSKFIDKGVTELLFAQEPKDCKTMLVDLTKIISKKHYPKPFRLDDDEINLKILEFAESWLAKFDNHDTVNK